MATPIKPDPRTDEKYMAQCLDLAALAAAAGEVPVGAMVVLEGRILGTGRNRTRERNSALAHAEMIALEAAFRSVEAADGLGDGLADGPADGLARGLVGGRVPGATLYCSLEPCFMCAGALLHARVARVVFAASDPKFGACGSLANLPLDERLNHRCPVLGGVLAEDSARMLRDFFQSLR